MSKYKLFICHNQQSITCEGKDISTGLAVAELNSLEYRNSELKIKLERLEARNVHYRALIIDLKKEIEEKG